MKHSALAVVIALLLSSCSWLVVTSPAESPNPLDCTTSRLAPAFDGTLAVIGGVEAGALFAFEDAPDWARVTFGVLGLVDVLIYSFSAAYGFSATNDCRGL